MSVSIGADKARNAANTGNTASNVLTLTYNSSAGPGVSISTTASSTTSTSPIPVTISFSETVTGFDITDISVVNGTAGNLIEAVSGKVWTANITPSGSGSVSVSIGADKARNVLNTGNTASNVLTLTYDSTGLSVSITTALSSPTRTNLIPVTITFSETVTGFQISDLTVTNGTVGNFINTTLDKVWTADVIPSGQGFVSISIAANSAMDKTYEIKGNTVSNTLSMIYDTVAPTNQNTVFGVSTLKKGGSSVTIISSGDANNSICFAPNGTTVFTEGSTMTKAIGTATSINAPAAEGSYKLFVIDQAGNVSDASTAVLTVDNTAPTDQDTVFASSIVKKGGSSVTIISSGDVNNSIWFAPIGTTVFAEGSAITKAIGTATSINAPTIEGSYKLYIVDQAGNISNGSAATLTVDTTAPINQNTVFASSIVKKGGSSVTIISSGDANNSIWFAPNGTTVFTEGSTMTKALGMATSINAPAVDGSYRLFIIDQAGNISNASTAVLTVDNTAPTNQDTVFALSLVKKGTGGFSVSIASSGDASNSVWFAPEGTTVFVEGSTMTKAGGTATSINAPVNPGIYKLYLIDQLGNVSNPSAAILKVESVYSYPVSDTGIILCYDNFSDGIPCPFSGDWYGQDANYSNIPYAPSYTNNGNGTVTDNVTGLVWQKCLAGQNNDSTCSGTAVTNTYQNALAYCDTLSLGGRDDWRLPAIEEIETLIKLDARPLIDTGKFQNGNGAYWSFSPYVSDTNLAWYFDFTNGVSNTTSMIWNKYVRCVVGGLN